MVIFKTFNVDVAHRLPNVPEGHKCSQVHGHTFRIEIHVGGPIQPGFDWVMDFADITKSFDPIYRQLDHRYINEIDGLENPTSENLAKWIWKHLKSGLPSLVRIVVQESPDSGCVYEGEDE